VAVVKPSSVDDLMILHGIEKCFEPVTINLVLGSLLRTTIELDIYMDGTMEINALVDTGASFSFVSKTILQDRNKNLLNSLEPCPVSFYAAGGNKMSVDGVMSASMRIDGRLFHHRFVVAEIVEDAILGVDFLNKHRINWDWDRNRMKFSQDTIDGHVNLIQAIGECVAPCDIHLPARTVSCHKLKLEGGINIIEHAIVSNVELPTTYFPSHVPEPYILDSIVKIDDNHAVIPIKNTNDCDLMIPQGMVLGIYEPLTDYELKSYDFQKDAHNDFLENEKLPFEMEFVTEKNQDFSINVIDSEDSHKFSYLVDKCEITIPEGKEEAVQKLFMEFKDVFKFEGEQLGKTNLETHKINLDGTNPVKQAPRRVPLNMCDEIEELIKSMEEAGVIKPSDSPWASPVVIVRKKDGTVRFCVDFRRLNEHTIKDAYPLPRVDECLDTLAGNRYFTSLDLASGYWQVEVAEEDKFKTAFTTKWGLYEWNVMPFGLTNAPATFQRLMERVLKGLQWKVLVLYLDDVVIYSKTFEEHLERLRIVFGRLRSAGLKLKPKKCHFFQNKIAFLGHQADASGIYTDPEKCKQIENWQQPKNAHEVRVFTGLTSYYRCFIPDYAKKAGCLHNLTKKGIDFEWTEECDQAFEYLKLSLSSQLQLSYPEKGAGFILDTDACDISIGGVLSQIQDGQEKVLRFASRCLNPAERNYCTTRKELLAVVYFMNYFKHYLLGTHVTVRTDHCALRWLKVIKDPSDQMARWIEKLAPFSWTIEYRRGKLHVNADSMSRRPCDGGCRQCTRIV
jgi:hypothetical protein